MRELPLDRMEASPEATVGRIRSERRAPAVGKPERYGVCLVGCDRDRHNIGHAAQQLFNDLKGGRPEMRLASDRPNLRHSEVTVPLRIAFDLDGVLADMESELLRQATILFGEQAIRQAQQRQSPALAEPQTLADTAKEAADAPDERPTDEPPTAEGAPIEPPATGLHLTSRQQRRLWRHVESIDGFWESLTEIEPGVIARLAALATARRWEIIFLTKRPESVGATAQLQTQRWLDAKGFAFPSVYVVQGSRGRIAAALGLDFVVDDRPENCLDVVIDSKARAILVWRDDGRQVPAATRRLGIGVVKSVAECLDILMQIDAPAEERSSIMDRVKRLLGLKEHANV